MAKNELTIEQLAQEIYQGAGGMANVESVNHCMTRVRMSINNHEKVNKEYLQKIPGILGVVDDQQLQVIIGPGKVNKVAKAMAAQAGVALGETIVVGDSVSGKEALNAKAAEMKAAQKAKQKQSPLKALLKDISNIFVPMIPAFVGAGLVAGIGSIIANNITAGNLDAATWQQFVDLSNILKNGMFSFLVIYTGVNAAQVFGATPTLGGVIGGVVTLTGMRPDAPLTNLFTGQPLAAQQGGILGVIFAVWLLAQIEKRLHEVVPEAVDIIVTPTLCLLAVGLAEIFFIMPLAGFISNALVGSINWVLGVGGAFAGFVLGASFLPMVMFGLHQILTPIHAQMIEATGSTQLLPILAMAGAGQVGAAFALWIRLRKNKELTEMIKGALPVGILGIGEPLIYGVTLPLGRPFITACIGGGIGGAIIGGLGNVGATAIGPSGVALIPLIGGGQWWGYVLGLLGAYAGGFAATLAFGIPKESLDAEQQEQAVVTTAISGTAAFHSVANGIIKPVTECSDQVFADKMMGDGYLIIPEDGRIYAPVRGVVSNIFPTKHAIGITTENGLEVLLHMGLDTVELAGEPFDLQVAQGQSVTPDTLLAKVDLELIRSKGKATDILVLVTNMEKASHKGLHRSGRHDAKQPVMVFETE